MSIGSKYNPVKLINGLTLPLQHIPPPQRYTVEFRKKNITYRITI